MDTTPSVPAAEPKRSGLKSLFSFNGRSRRSTYWAIMLTTYFLCFLAEEFLTAAEQTWDETTVGLMAIGVLVLGLAAIWVYLATATRRFHDLGKSGWYILFFCVPIANLIFSIYVAFFKGMERDNEYGPNPY